MKILTQRLTCLLVSAFVLTAAPGTASAGPAVPRIAGTWEIVGTPDPGGCGPSQSFVNITTVTREGFVSNVDPVVGATIGQAYKLGEKRYAIGFFGFLSPAPGLTLRLEVQATLGQLNAGEAAGRFRSIVTDPNGILPECVYEGTISGTRLVPLPY